MNYGQRIVNCRADSIHLSNFSLVKWSSFKWHYPTGRIWYSAYFTVEIESTSSPDGNSSTWSSINPSTAMENVGIMGKTVDRSTTWKFADNFDIYGRCNNRTLGTLTRQQYPSTKHSHSLIKNRSKQICTWVSFSFSTFFYGWYQFILLLKHLLVICERAKIHSKALRTSVVRL